MGKPQVQHAWTMLWVAAIAWALIPGRTRADYPQDFSWGGYEAGAKDDLLSPVRDQLRLGPCYSFAAVGLVETMNDLLYGPGDPSDAAASHTGLSVVHVYSCGGRTGLPDALNLIHSSGAVYTSCSPALSYPAGSCLNAADQEPNKLVWAPQVCAGREQTCGRRVRADFYEVTSEMARGDAAIQALLMNRGPIAVTLEYDPFHLSSHGILLYGWRTTNGQLEWLVRDSWPCQAGLFARASSSFQLASQFGAAHPHTQAFVVDRIYHEVWDAAAGWVDVTPAPRPFVLRPASQAVKLTSPPCFNNGEIGVTGLDRLPGAQIVGWSLWSNGSAILSFPGGKPTLSGNAYNARVTATVRRASGMLENVTQEFQYLGMPVQVSQQYSFCAGTRREIQLTSSAMTPGVASWSIDVDPSSRGSYYVMGNGSTSPYIVFTAVDSASYKIRVTGAAPGCSGTFGGYAMGMPCITYP